MTSSTINPPPLLPTAILTDVFGTVVNWHPTVTAHLIHSASIATPPSPSLKTRLSPADWSTFALQWRHAYYVFTRGFNPATDPWVNIDDHMLTSLHTLLHDWNITSLWTPDEVKSISRIWHALDPWPDSASGLSRIQTLGITTATLSNGNVSLLRDLASHGALPYDRFLSAEDFGAYKPNPLVYNGAVKALGLEGREGEVAMVAAHLGDLEAAKKCGLRCVYVERGEEEQWGREKVQEAKEAGWVDFWVTVRDGVDGEEGEANGGLVEVARRWEEVVKKGKGKGKGQES